MLSAADASLVANDTEIPGLPVLLDPDAVTETLNRLYPDAVVETVEPRYVRYKPRMSCLVGYTARTAAGRVELYARAHNPDVNDKAARAQEADDVPTPLGGGIRVVPDRALVFFPFPNDHELPALRYLADDAAREGMLRNAIRTEAPLWSGRLEAVRYKPERRFVARLRIANGSGAAMKFYRRDDYEAVRDMSDVFDSIAPLRVPRRIDRSKRYRVAIVEWLDGVPLPDVLVRGDVSSETWSTIGAAIARLHGQMSSKLRKHHTAEASVASLRGAAAAVAEIAPAQAERAMSLAERIARKMLRSRWRVRRAIHGDLSAEQFILLPDAVAVVDFDRAGYGDPRLDLGTFAARLVYDAETGTVDPAVAAACADGVLEGYRAASDKDVTRKVDRFTAASLLQMAVEPFRHRLADWPERIDAILGRAESLVSGERTGAA